MRQRFKSEMRIVASVRPRMPIFGPAACHQKDASSTDAFGEKIQEDVAVGIDPLKVFEDDHQRMLETLAQKNTLDRFERFAPPDLAIHVRERIGRILNSQ